MDGRDVAPNPPTTPMGWAAFLRDVIRMHLQEVAAPGTLLDAVNAFDEWEAGQQ